MRKPGEKTEKIGTDLFLFQIEKGPESRHLLVLENLSWISGPDTTLEDIERKLFDFACDA